MSLYEDKFIQKSYRYVIYNLFIIILGIFIDDDSVITTDY